MTKCKTFGGSGTRKGMIPRKSIISDMYNLLEWLGSTKCRESFISLDMENSLVDVIREGVGYIERGK